MKIISFAVNNFGCLTGGQEKNIVKFDNSNTIFLFGQNNSGKSSFLKGYQYFYENKQPKEEDFYLSDYSNEITYELVVELHQDEIEKIKEDQKKGEYLLDNYLDDDNVLRFKNGWKLNEEKINYFGQTYNPSTRNWDEKFYGGIGLHHVFQELLPRPIFIEAMPTEERAEQIVNDILKIKADEFLKKQTNADEYKEALEKLNRLRERIYNPQSIDNYENEVNQQFQKLFSDTKIKIDPKPATRFTASNIGQKFEVKFNRLDSSGSVDERIPSSYEKLGHGAVRTAIFSLFLMRDIVEELDRTNGKKDYIVLFEEPELFLHPRLTKVLRDLIYEVSSDDTPFQIICASHSPQMIDLTKIKTSLVRLSKSGDDTEFYQLTEDNLYIKDQTGEPLTAEESKQVIYEVLRFNPYICESFYADEVLLVEGDTEEILLRGYLQEVDHEKDLFVVNCGTVNNIPFYQRIFSNFNIKYHVICDTDNEEDRVHVDDLANPTVEGCSGIQKSIVKQYLEDTGMDNYQVGLLRFHDTTIEPAHRVQSIPTELRFPESSSNGKPYDANKYWKKVISTQLGNPQIGTLPIISYIKEILEH